MTTTAATAASTSSEVANYIAANYGLTDAVLSMDKTDPAKGFTLREAFDQIKGPPAITDPNKAANILAKTNWYQAHGVAVTHNLALERTSPGVFQSNVDAAYATLKDRAAALGYSATDTDLRAMARQQYVFGLNDSQVTDQMLASHHAKYNGGGSTGQSMDALAGFAYQSGVTINATDKAMWANQLLAGNKTEVQYADMLRERSAQTYHVFADQIRAGQNLSDLTSAYRDKAAALLEVDPSTIQWDDPLFRDGKAFTAVGADGKPAVKPLWDFAKEIKADSRWQYTQNAHDTFTNAGASLLKRFGMVA